MISIEAKLDALMNKLGNNERRIHSAHEVGIVNENEKRSNAEEGLAHERAYQVEDAHYLNGNRSYNINLTSTYQLFTHQHSGTIKISHMEEEHSKVKDLGRIINSLMPPLGSNNNNSSKEVREQKIRHKGDLLPLKSRC